MSVVASPATAAEQAALVRAGEVTARELVEASLAAIEASDLNAFVAVAAERALAEADAVRPGDPRPLAGVPIGIKDLFVAVDGLPITHGSAAFGDRVAERDSPHVARLRAAGAIVVGLTNTPELGLRPVTEPVRHGPTRNPRDPRLSPGGSSGGSAAAVAGGLVALCDGSDAGGSIRIPAACCGVVGIKPSRGRVPNDPLIADLADAVVQHGPLARTVADAAAALEVMAGRELGRSLPSSVRLALTAPLGVPVDRVPAEAARRAGELLTALGHDVTEHAPDWDDDGFAGAWATAMTATMRQIVRRLGPADADRLEPATRGWLLETPPVAAADQRAAAARLGGYAARVLRGWPDDGVLVTPTLTRLPVEIARLRARPGVSDDAARFSALTRVWNVTGQPALSLPLGGTGVQIVGPPGREDLVLGLAAQLEASGGTA